MRETDGLALLYQVDVLPEVGGRGIGRALVLRAVSHAREAGYDYLYLTTFRHVPWNAPFYAKLGFAALADEDMPEPLLASLQEERIFSRNRIAMRKPLRERYRSRAKRVPAQRGELRSLSA